jgi:site-specific recombinase XerC
MKGHLRERSPGHWAIILDLPDDTRQRKRKWHSFRGTKRQAQDECAKLIAALKAGSYVELSKENVAAYLERWLADVKSRVSPRTHERYAQLLRKNIVPTLGAKRIKDLKAEHVSAVYAAALANGRVDGTGGLSRRSVRHAHVVLKGALKQAVQWGLIAKNPCDDVKPQAGTVENAEAEHVHARVGSIDRHHPPSRIRFHDLRHAHATHLLASGVHPKVASERLGHSRVGITLDTYSHVLPNMQADAAAVVDGALRAVLNKPGS